MKNRIEAIKKIQLVFTLILILVLISGCSTAGNELKCTENQTLINNECVDEEVLIEDTTSPVISGAHNLNYAIGDDEPDYLIDVTALDDIDGDVLDQVVLNTDAVDLTTAGEYDVIISVTDSSGNQSSVTVIVVVTGFLIDYAALVSCNA